MPPKILQQAMRADHARHRRERDGFLSSEERAHLAAQGMLSALDARGIGGIAEPSRIRCCTPGTPRILSRQIRSASWSMSCSQKVNTWRRTS